MFKKILIANRGTIACRILKTLRRMDIAPVAVYSDADRYALHVRQAEESVHLGAAPAAESYLRQDALIAAALSTGAQAIHPGYGFLSENAAFAERCEQAGIAFIGPTPQQMRDFGLKHTARALAELQGLPLLPGSGLLADLDEAKHTAQRLRYPVMLKSTAGGGGIGMSVCRTRSELETAYQSVERLAKSNFSQGGLFIEKYVERARHIEVQIFGDGTGTVAALGERDCSVQRRNQKVIEETPAPNISDALRQQLYDAAQRLGRSVNYRSAGTVEFVYDVATGEFYFLEVNTRLQVEHGVTEAVTGIDLVEWMVRAAAGETLPLQEYRHRPRGHAIQVRLYAEDPLHHFRPASGLLTAVEFPQSLRVDTWIEAGTEVSSHYDPLLAKVIAHAPTRAAALMQLQRALEATQLYGIETNLEYLRQVARDAVFDAGDQYTRYLTQFQYRPLTIEVLQGGTHSTVQDYPGRVGFWDVGVPPSGPMDNFAFRTANEILGNAVGAAGLEFTATGPTLRFHADTVVALCGARMVAQLDGQPIQYHMPIAIKRGSVLKLGKIEGAGQRTYLAVKCGLDVAMYLGSAATFTLGQFGGHAGRALRAGDSLHLHESSHASKSDWQHSLPAIAQYTNHWDIDVLYGPHGAPEFFTVADIDMFFATQWVVHYNSSRTGVRLIGPKPQWARSDGGEAGLHPSNIHDNAYAIGAIDFTGDMPVILGPDGPSLGGFVCPATIVEGDLWKLGQLRPGDTIRFRHIARSVATGSSKASIANAVLHRIAASQERPEVCYRQSGDRNLLIEYGPPVLDLDLRFRVHALMNCLQGQRLPGVIDLTPGIRSLQVHFDSKVWSQGELLAVLIQAESQLPAVDEMEVASRIVYLPLSWDDPATRVAIEKYMQSVRRDAPWRPSNIEFIRRINGLADSEEVRRIVFDASYLVMGLGDVYLGAPVATPLDPRHRLVTTKYNPARTWTPENAVGIGGAYLCIYGMEGPGGYQFVGRTLQMWNRYRQTADFPQGKPWLLRFFDRIRFYPVSAQELLQLREDFTYGQFKLRVAEGRLSLREYHGFLEEHRVSIDVFKRRQQAAFDAERERWRAAGTVLDGLEDDDSAQLASNAPELLEGYAGVASSVSGSVWQVMVAVGQRVVEGQELVIVEAMKMEIPIVAEDACEIVEIRCTRGRAVRAGELLLITRKR